MTPGLLRSEKVPRQTHGSPPARKQAYEPLPQGLKALAALLVLRDKVIQSLLAAALQTPPPRGAQNPTRLDRHHETLRVDMQAAGNVKVVPVFARRSRAT